MIITRTPLRMSFLGGGTDYPEHFEQHGGAVLGSAVDKACFFTATPLPAGMFDYRLRIAYKKVECVSQIDELEHRPFRECLRWAGWTRDVEIATTAELPAMTGLGSSSSFSVGLLNTIYTHQRRPLPPLELAYRAIEFERGVLRESVGCQDQTFAAVGGFNLIEFRALGDFVVHRVNFTPERLRELESHLLCFFTGIRRRAETLARAQTQRVNQNRARLAQMRELVDDGYRILTGTGSLAPFGELLHQSWVLKRELAREVTSPEIDRWYHDAIDAGAIGGKLLGAGGGGFLLFLAPPETHEFIRERLADLIEVTFRLDAPGSCILFNNTSETAQPVQRAADAPRPPAFAPRLLEVA